MASSIFLNPPGESRLTELERSAFTIIPVPFDQTSTWIKGADKGPDAILEASAFLEYYDIETETEPYKAGIYTCSADIDLSDPYKMANSVRKRVSEYLKKDKIPIILGGEHSVSIGAAQAITDHFKSVSVLQLDAHSDLRDEYEGSAYNHACVMARIRELCPIVQAGIRSMDRGEIKNLDKERIFYAKDIYNNRDWIDNAVSLLPENVYITIDLDVFDPSIMAATGTPEPGGLYWYDVLELLKKVAMQKRIVGFDVVELCPSKELYSCDFLAAKLIYKLMAYIYKYNIL